MSQPPQSRASSRVQPSRAARDTQLTGPEQINANLYRTTSHPTETARQNMGSPQIVFAQPEIISPQSQRVPGSYANVTLESSRDPEEPTITMQQTHGTHNAPLVNLWGETPTPHAQNSPSPAQSYYHPVTGSYLPVTLGSRAASSHYRQTPATEPRRRAIMDLPHLGMPVNRQRFMEANRISTPPREPLIHEIRAPSARSIEYVRYPEKLHTQVQQLLNTNTLVQGDLRALQRNYETTWREAHTAFTLANNEREQSQETLAHMNELRDCVNEIGSQLTAVTHRQNDHESFMEELAVQVNAQEERLSNIRRYGGIRPESTRTCQ